MVSPLFSSALGAVLYFAQANVPTAPSQALLDKLAMAETEQQAFYIAEDVIDAWVDAGGPTCDILMERAIDAHAAQDHELARDMLDRVILIEPELAEAWYRRGALFYRDGKFDEAIKDFEEAIRYEPRHFEAWLGLAVIFEAIENRSAALEAYRRVIAIHPFSPYAIQAERRLAPLVDGRAL